MDSIQIVKAEHEIIEIEGKLRTINGSLVAIEEELSKLDQSEKITLENIYCLKQGGTVVMASGFRAAKENLKRVENRKKILVEDQKNYIKIKAGTEKLLKQKQDYLSFLKAEPENNVIYANFEKAK